MGIRDWFLLVVGVGILCLISIPIAILIGFDPVEGVFFIIGGSIFIIVFLVNPEFAYEQFGWIGLGVWVGIYATLGLAYYFLEYRPKQLEKRKKGAIWDLEGQAEGQATSEVGYGLMELKEQLGRGAITQEEYEQKKKRALKDEKN